MSAATFDILSQKWQYAGLCQDLATLQVKATCIQWKEFLQRKGWPEGRLMQPNYPVNAHLPPATKPDAKGQARCAIRVLLKVVRPFRHPMSFNRRAESFREGNM